MALAAHAYGWSFDHLRDMPLATLCSFVHAAAWLEGAVTEWVADDAAGAEKTLSYLKKICRQNTQ